MAAQEQHRLGAGHGAGKFLDLALVVQDLLDLGRDLAEIGQDVLDLALELVTAQLCQIQAQQVRGRDLRQESLGGSHRDLRTGVRVEHGV
ncbi:hypothetical protein D9M72_328160 [compost metagenome]